ncbi:MAG: helix-turn-helix transcriptional regulator [Prochloraceae cyanobacterium]|nr:helix-turn-helix transcriptional regulator [Prochloraceae cyanobacterium]
MDISQAFDKTLKDFNLTAREVAEKAGIREGVISKFRNSRQTVQTDTLDKLLNALNNEAKIYFCSLLVEKKIDLDLIIAEMDNVTLSKLLLIASERINPKENPKEENSSDNKITESDDKKDKNEVFATEFK